MNIVILSGKVANKFDNGGNVRFTIADNYKDHTTFITVTAFSNTADFVRRYINIGDSISIEGRVGNYTDNGGQERISIIANKVNFEGYQRRKEDISFLNDNPDFEDVSSEDAEEGLPF